jgi:hypothetical protein
MFRLMRAPSFKQLPEELMETIELGLQAARRTLALMAAPLASALGHLAESASTESERTRARSLSEVFAAGRLPENFSQADVRLLEEALQHGAMSTPVRVVRPPVEAYGLVTREDLRARINQWLDELPGQPTMVEVVGDGGL